MKENISILSTGTSLCRQRNQILRRRLLLAVLVGLVAVSSVSCLSRSPAPRDSSKKFSTNMHTSKIMRPAKVNNRVRGYSRTELQMEPTALVDDGNNMVSQMQAMKRDALKLLRDKKFEEALMMINDMVSFLQVNNAGDGTVSAIVDESIQAFTTLAFSQPFGGTLARERIRQGLQALNLQLAASSLLAPPFNAMPRATFVRALKALAGIITNNSANDLDGKPVDDAFRILQRLITGTGVRQKHEQQLSDRDFNVLLNAVSHMGRMDMAHKIVALQERTVHAPPLSAVSYSILLKGYGRLQDLQNVEMILSHAKINDIEPDTIMLNSLIDALVNCNEIERAQDVLNHMKDPEYKSDGLSNYVTLLSSHALPSPNSRTYNTVLKGLARSGRLREAIHLSREMKANDMWDDVTTNTLVSAAVKVKDFDLAENILQARTTVLEPNDKRRKHPNVEAYTELLDGYAKASMLDKALGVLPLMNRRKVTPNEYTYTCIIGGLAKAKKVDQAIKMLEYMESKNMKPRTVTYNTFISGLVSPQPTSDSDAVPVPVEKGELSHYASEGIKLLRRMLNAGVLPNAVTLSVLVDGLGRCEPPRLAEAKAIVEKLGKSGIAAVNDRKVATAMIRACGLGHDFKCAVEYFRQMNEPDVVAVNAFLDSCCRCDHVSLAFDTFERYIDKGKVEPDVITYSTLITALLQQETPAALQRTRLLYREMRKKRGIMPDKVLVDIILTAMVRGGRVGLEQKDIQFARTVIADAKNLDWEPGQFEKRRQALRAVLVGRISEVWKENEEWYGMAGANDDEMEDELFKKKGWNKVDSGFRLWGGGLDDIAAMTAEEDPMEDEFLASKGWNDVDSGFRII